MSHVIYIHTCKVNGKSYVGITNKTVGIVLLNTARLRDAVPNSRFTPPFANTVRVAGFTNWRQLWVPCKKRTKWKCV